MRGQQTFNTLFNELIEIPEKASGKGRNADFDTQRNELLLYRYCYYGKYTQLRYAVTLERLSSEFFLTPRRIADIVSANSSIARRLKDYPPTIKELKAKYPHFVW